MALLQAQVIIPNDSGLTEDAVINTWHFSTGDTEAGTINAIGAALLDFYTLAVPPSVNKVSDFLSDFLNPAAGRWKVVNLSEPKPRVPIRDEPFTFSVPAGNGFPNEVAIVASFQAAKESGLNQARRRGRIYLGPVKSSTGTAAAGEFRPSSGVLDVINGAALRLRNASDAAALWTWIVYSGGARDNSDKTIPYDQRPLLPATFAPVANGWMDDAYDTQRRRGRDATSRSVWS